MRRLPEEEAHGQCSALGGHSPEEEEEVHVHIVTIKYNKISKVPSFGASHKLNLN